MNGGSTVYFKNEYLMRVVIQRVTHASVTIDGICKSAIKEGFMILLGIEAADSQEDADWLCKKIVNLRV